MHHPIYGCHSCPFGKLRWLVLPLYPFFIKVKCAKIVTVNLKMGTYNSGKFKGAKSYTINQNGAKVTSQLDRVRQTFSRCDPTISKWRVIHLRVQYVDGALYFQMRLYFFRWLRRSKVDFTWFGALFDFLSKWLGLGFVSSDLGFNWMHFSFHSRFWKWHIIYWWWSPRLENFCLTWPNRDVTFTPFWFTIYGFALFWFTVYNFVPLNLPEL